MDGRAASLDLAPSTFALFPEYLTDPFIVVCPSDPEAGEAETLFQDPDEDNLDCFGLYVFPATGSDEGKQRCSSAADISYTYLGWVLDCYEPSCPRLDFSSLATILSLLSTLPVDASEEGPEQIVRVVESLFAPEVLNAFTESPNSLSPAEAADVNEVFDRDVDVPPGIGNGGGESDTVFRFREGIERFLITDINNPAASAQAQSTLPIYFDQVAVVPSAFNHIPGGINILFLDGHVDFETYAPDSDGLANQYVANSLGIVSGIFTE